MDTTGVISYSLLVFVVLFHSVKTSLISTKVDLCGPIMELILDQFDESSATIAFAVNEYTPVCKLKISAPETHVIYLNIIETIPEELQRELRGTERSESCHLNVYQHGNSEPVWSGDPCSQRILSDIDLLHPEVILEWSPPTDLSHAGKKLLVTAVGRGDVCKDSLQHTCMSIGYEPLFCVSKYLLCDGNQNCPKGATKNDEDAKQCKITWSIFFKQFKHPEINDRILNVLLTKTTKPPKIYSAWEDWPYLKDEVTTQETTTVETQTTNIETLSAALSHYGPWGYILLGLLICGTVLMFCGVWECFRKPKPPVEPAQAAQPTATTTTTAVLIIQEDSSPPRYDDLEPPSYATLFPNIKEDDDVQTNNRTSTVPGTNDQSRQDQGNSVNENVLNETNIYPAVETVNLRPEFSDSTNIAGVRNNSNNFVVTDLTGSRYGSASAIDSSVSATDFNVISPDFTIRPTENNISNGNMSAV